MGVWVVLGSDPLWPLASNAIKSWQLDDMHPSWLDAGFLSCPVSLLPLAALRHLMYHILQVGQPSP